MARYNPKRMRGAGAGSSDGDGGPPQRRRSAVGYGCVGLSVAHKPQLAVSSHMMFYACVGERQREQPRLTRRLRVDACRAGMWRSKSGCSYSKRPYPGLDGRPGVGGHPHVAGAGRKPRQARRARRQDGGGLHPPGVPRPAGLRRVRVGVRVGMPLTLPSPRKRGEGDHDVNDRSPSPRQARRVRWTRNAVAPSPRLRGEGRVRGG